MVIKDGAKMSKSKGNVVDPDDLIRRYGADTARLFSLFAAPPEKDLDWNDRGVEGASRFLNRIWRFVHTNLPELTTAPRAPAGPLSDAGRAFRRIIHATIQKVTHDIEHDFHFNTAISAVMELVNALHDFERASLDGMARPERSALLREAVEATVLLLGPVSPHITEELWAALGHRGEPVQAGVARGGPGRARARRGGDRACRWTGGCGAASPRRSAPRRRRSARWPSPTGRCFRGSTGARSPRWWWCPGASSTS